MKRVLFLIVVAALCAWAFVVFVERPLVCNSTLNRLGGRTRAARESARDVEIAALAHANLAELRRMEGHCRTSVYLYTIEADNEDLLGQKEEAIATLRRALTIDQRPELYFGIGNLLVDLGRTDEAVEWYLTPVRLSPEAIDRVPSSVAADRIRKRLRETAARGR